MLFHAVMLQPLHIQRTQKKQVAPCQSQRHGAQVELKAQTFDNAKDHFGHINFINISVTSSLTREYMLFVASTLIDVCMFIFSHKIL